MMNTRNLKEQNWPLCYRSIDNIGRVRANIFKQQSYALNIKILIASEDT